MLRAERLALTAENDDLAQAVHSVLIETRKLAPHRLELSEAQKSIHIARCTRGANVGDDLWGFGGRGR